MRGTGAIVFRTRVDSFSHKHLSCTFVETDRQLWSIDGVNVVELNATFCLLWREQHRVGGGSATSSEFI